MKAMRLAVCAAMLMTSSVFAQESRNGSFSLQGFANDDFAGKSVSYGTEATYTVDIHSDNGTPFVDHMIFNASTVDGSWYMSLFSGVSHDISTGRFCTDGTNADRPSLSFDYSRGPICSPAEATMDLGRVEVEYPANFFSPRAVALTGTFSVRCSGQTLFNTGTFTFAAPSTGAPSTPDAQLQQPSGGNCTGGGANGGGGGGGFPTPGGGTGGGGGNNNNGVGTIGGFPHPGGNVIQTPAGGTDTPQAEPPVPAVTVVTNRSADQDGVPFLMTDGTVSVPLLVVGSNLTQPLALTATSDPDGLAFKFTSTTLQDGKLDTAVTITPTETALPRDYRVDVTASSGDTTSTTSFLITLDCDPPKIFGTPGNQPVSQTVQSGKAATLDVKPAGSGPFRYQWFRGSSGQTNFPVANATNKTFTPTVTGPEAYWVRVSNACGSVDSATALVSTGP